MVLRLIEVGLVCFWIWLIFALILIPLYRGTPLFRISSKRERNLEGKLADAVQSDVEDKIEEKIESMKKEQK